DARQLAAHGTDKLANKIFHWAELLTPHSGAAFEDIAAFSDANPSWPSQDVLSRRAEEALVERTDDSVVLAWFALRGPTTVDGSMRYAEALLRSGEREKASQLIHAAWASGAFGPVQETTFLKRYKSYLSMEEHVRRLDRLIWDGRYDEARRMLPRVDADHRALGDARIRLATMSKGAEYALRKVPERLAQDQGLVFERLRWRHRKGQEQAALDMLRQAPSHVVRPEVWWTERNYLARRAITAGRMSDAYEIAVHNELQDGAKLAEAEFLTGWVALRFLHKPDVALGHFTRLYEQARFPVTQSRGAYWAGRAADAAGDKAAAQDWYRKAAGFLTTYYGQLAAGTLDVASRPAFPESPAPSEEERKSFEASELVRATRLLQQIGQTLKVKTFVTRLVLNAKTPGEHTLVSELATRIDRPDLAVAAAKRSAQTAGITIPDYGWPVIPLPAGEAPEKALVYATIRQESAFEAAAVSHMGARGLMQVIAPTARAVARKMGIATEHIDTRLLNEPKLNLTIGRRYLDGLIDDYDGSYVLALAAYNAGPGRVKQWVRDNGDPRRPNVDVVDWIELIPIDETRNYIHRVLENLQVYRQRLGATQVALGIDQDLRRRRSSEATQ
ncbi:MAG: lytic transglycosylase domain-containing protein, partial [Alphaproteobacteria bacterium]|nr:lytic transglycosylase domain-containing protein [Alphaproteobacteria bacterium]